MYRRVFGWGFRVTDADVRLYLALIRAARPRLVDDYPGLSFHVIQWGTKHREALAELEPIGIQVHYIDDILPGYNENPAPFFAEPHDWHPQRRDALAPNMPSTRSWPRRCPSDRGRCV